MPPLMKRIEREVLEGKLRAKNRIREHSEHEWKILRDCGDILLMDCPCNWVGWIPKEMVNETI